MNEFMSLLAQYGIPGLLVRELMETFVRPHMGNNATHLKQVALLLSGVVTYFAGVDAPAQMGLLPEWMNTAVASVFTAYAAKAVNDGTNIAERIGDKK